MMPKPFAALAALAAAATASPALAGPLDRNWIAPRGISLAPRNGTFERAAEPYCPSSNGSDISYLKGVYKEPYRPQIHLSPTHNFANDPNGLLYNGTHWLAYYQYNPTADVAGNQHWGHAVSTDLYHWVNYPPAISPDEPGVDAIFSGSAVLDVNNTSGFFNDSVPAMQRVVAIYTKYTNTSQTQEIAWSVGGQSFVKYENNPVLAIANETQFRDPKVHWDSVSSSWVMTVARAQQFAIEFYSSPDLKSWTKTGEFKDHGVRGYQYECPGIFSTTQLGGPNNGTETYVLIISINPGAPLGGSYVQYFVGDWDGKTFTAKDAVARTADFGKDFYAVQLFDNILDDRKYALGWASNWQYTQEVPTTPWRSQMSLPREYKLQWAQITPQRWDYVLSSFPVEEKSLVDRVISEQALGGNVSAASITNQTIELDGEAFRIDVTFSVPKNTTAPATSRRGFVNVGAGDNVLKTWIDAREEPVLVGIDRSKAGGEWAQENLYFTDKLSSTISGAWRTVNDTASDWLVTLHVFVDRSVTELFVNDGLLAATTLTYWDQEAVPDTLNISSTHADVKVESVNVVSFKSVWGNYTC